MRFIGKNRNLAFLYYFKCVAKNFSGIKYSVLSLKSRFYCREILFLLINFASFTYKKTI